MTIFIRPPSWLPPLRKERSPAKAAIIGLLFGGLGLGLYFKSVVDFLIPVLFTIASTAVAAATARTGGSVVGFLGATMVAGAGDITGRGNRTHASQPPKISRHYRHSRASGVHPRRTVGIL